MVAYTIQRLIVGVIQVAIVAMATFIVLRFLPLDPASVFAGPTADGESRAIVARALGLDKPVLEQLVIFIQGVFQGSLGQSWVLQKPVLGEIAARLPITLQLMFAGMTIAIVLGTLLGYAIAASESSGGKGRRPLSALGRGYILASGSQPEFLWGLVFILVFFRWLGWVPAPFGVLSGPPPAAITGFIGVDALIQGDWAALRDFSAHLVLPVATMCSVLIGPIAKVVRESILPVMGSSYYLNLRTQGAGRWRQLRCVARNGGAPVVMLLGVLFGPVLGGVALVETIYSIDGLVRLTVHSTLAADFPMVQGCVTTIAALCLFGYIVADLVAGWLNPNLVRRARSPFASLSASTLRRAAPAVPR